MYISILFNKDENNFQFGYADDIALTGIGNTALQAVAAVQGKVDKVVQLASEHKIDFDPTKSELLIIGGGPKKKLNVSGLAIKVKDHNVDASPCVKWLGVWLDTQLNFKQHVQEWCGKAHRVAQFIRQINTVQRGLNPGMMIKTVQACVLSTAFYGVEAWWPGLTRTTTQRDKRVGTGVGWHIDLIDRTVLKAVRAALPVWRTTPNKVLHRESGIPPAEILLQQRQLQAAARVQRLDTWHPLVFRSREEPKDTINRLGLRAGQKDRTFKVPDRYLTRLQMSAKTMPVAEKPGKIYYPKGKPISDSLGGRKQDEVLHAKQWIASLSDKTICAYSDGSSCGPARSAWGYALYRNGQMIGKEAGQS